MPTWASLPICQMVMEGDEMRNLTERFEKWDAMNPHFYTMFKKFTFEAINKGHTKLSAWLVSNRIRWETTIVTKGEPYKISNDFIALYARKFMKDYPEYEGFFRTKEMKRV